MYKEWCTQRVNTEYTSVVDQGPCMQRVCQHEVVTVGKHDTCSRKCIFSLELFVIIQKKFFKKKYEKNKKRKNF